MPPPVANPIRDRAIELGRKMGCRGVVEALKREGYVVGKSAVAEWIRAGKARQAGEHAGERTAAKKSSKAKGAAPNRDTKPAKAKGRPAVDEMPDPAPSPGRTEAELADVDPVALDFAELVKLDEEVTDFLRRAHQDEDERRYAVLARLKLDVRIALEKLRPAPKVDPDADPLSLAAREAVFGKLKKMVANAKAAAAPPGGST